MNTKNYNYSKKILNELKIRKIIRPIIENILNEEGPGVWKDGQLDAFADQKQVNRLQKQKDKLEREKNPPPAMVKKAWKNHWGVLSGILEDNGWSVVGESKNSEVFAYKISKIRSGATDINSLYEKVKSSFRYPDKVKKFTIRPEYSPEQVSYAFGVIIK